jgi:hypothetical protein
VGVEIDYGREGEGGTQVINRRQKQKNKTTSKITDSD